VIKRIFGVIKRKFKILATPGEFLINTQVHLVLGLGALYNFIRSKEGVELEEGDLDSDTPGDSTPLLNTGKTAATKAIEALRDTMAENMWVDYCNYIRRDI
jgi:hypothetical protein